MTDELPDVIARYQTAHDRGDTEGALAAFTETAHVRDDGRDHTGRAEVRSWLDETASAFTYTRTLIDAVDEGEGRWLVQNHLEGDFPGGQVDLRYRFVLSEGRISELVIAP